MTHDHDGQVGPARGRVLGLATAFTDYMSMLGARIGSAALSLVSIMITARLLEPVGYGAVAYYAVVSLLIFTVTSAWTSTAVSRYGREMFESRGSLVELTWARAVISLPLFFTAALLVVGLQAAGAFPPEFDWAFTVLAIGYGAILVVSDHLIYSLEAAGRIKLSALWTIGQHAGIVVSLLFIAAAGIAVTPIAVAGLSAAWNGVFMIMLLRAEWGLAIWPIRGESALTRRIAVFSIPMIAFTASQYLVRSVDLFVLGAVASAATVGIYAIAYQAYTVLQQLTTATGPVLTPLFVSLQRAGSESAIAQYNRRIIPQLTFLAAILIGLSLPLVEIAVPLVFGEPFADAAIPLAILLLAILLGFTANLLSPILVLHERTREIGAINVVAAIANVVGDVVLIVLLEIHLVGPAIATVLAIAIILVAYDVVASRCTRSPASSSLRLLAVTAPLFGSLIPVLALSGAAGAVSAVAAVGAAAVVVQLWVRPFVASDAALIERLDLPAPLKRLTLRSLRFAVR